MRKIKASLYLSCDGSEFNDITLCKGVSNPVIILDEISDEKYEAVIGFMDSACNLFDYIMYDKNKVSNTLNLLHRQFGVFDESKLFGIQAFMAMHRKCGIRLHLELTI